METNEFITGWVYKKGELARRRLNNFTIGLSAAISLVVCLLVVFPLTQLDPTIKGKIGDWVFFMAFVGLAVLIYFVLKFFFTALFGIYKKLSGVGEEEIIFTNKKITSTKKTWMLNDESTRLTSVTFSTDGKAPSLVFKGIEQKPGKSPYTYNVELPVPKEEIRNAEKVYAYFKSKLPETA